METYKVRKRFEDLGKVYLPGDTIDLTHFTRPESMIRGGFVDEAPVETTEPLPKKRGRPPKVKHDSSI